MKSDYCLKAYLGLAEKVRMTYKRKKTVQKTAITPWFINYVNEESEMRRLQNFHDFIS